MFKPDKIIVSPRILQEIKGLMQERDPRDEEVAYYRYMMQDAKTYYGHCKAVLVDLSVYETPYYKILEAYLDEAEEGLLR